MVSLQIAARYSGVSGHYNNVGCSARLKTSFELNPVTGIKQGTFPFSFLFSVVCSAGSYRHGDDPGLCFDCEVGTYRTADIDNCTACTTLEGSNTLWRTNGTAATSQQECQRKISSSTHTHILLYLYWYLNEEHMLGVILTLFNKNTL